MPCRIKIKKELQKEVENTSQYLNGLNYNAALSGVRKFNRDMEFKVLDLFNDPDIGSMISVNIPSEMVDAYYDKEFRIEESQAREMLTEDTERAGIAYSDRYLFDDLSEQYDNDIDRQRFEAFSLTEELQKKTRDAKIAAALADKYSKAFGIKNEVITSDEAREILKDTATPYNNQSGFYFNNKVFLVKDKFDAATVLHEYAHPFLKAIQIDNPKLFNKLYAQLETSITGQGIISLLKVSGVLEEGTDRFKEEAIIRAIEKDGDDKINNIKSNDQSFNSFIKGLLFALKQVIRKLAKRLNLKKLDTNTTIGELTDILLKGDFVVDTSMLTPLDIAEFRDENTQMLEELKNITPESLQNTVNNFYGQFSELNRYLLKNNDEIRKVLEETKVLDSISSITKALNSVQTLNLSKEDQEQLINVMESKDINYQSRAFNFIKSLHESIVLGKRIQDIVKDMKRSKEYLTQEGSFKTQYFADILEQQKKFLKDDVLKSLEGLPDGSELKKKILISRNITSDALDEIADLQFETVKNYMYENSEGVNIGIENQFKVRYEPVLNDAGYTKEQQDKFLKNIIKRAKKEGQIKKYTTDMLKQDLGGTVPAGRKKYLDKYIQEFAALYITPQILDSMLRGEKGDMNYMAANYIPYVDINDPSISFVMGMNKELSDAAVKSQKDQNRFMNSILPLLDEVGYDPNKTSELRDMLFQLDDVGIKNDMGEFEEWKVYTLINKFKGWRKDYNQLKHNLEAAVESEDKTKIAQAQDELWKFEEDYMHRKYSDKFYEINKIWKQANTVIDPNTGKEILVSKELSTEAWEEKNLLQNKKSTYQQSDYRDADDFMPFSRLDMANKDYQNLFSLIDAEGNYKTGDELKKTLVRLKHREESKDIYEFNTDYDAAQDDLDKFMKVELPLRKIYPTGETAEQYEQEVREFIDRNYVSSPSQQYFDEVKEITDKIKALTDKGGVSSVAKKLNKISTQRSLLLKVSSSDGVPDGMGFTQGQIRKLKELDVEYAKIKEEFNAQTGLSIEELESFKKLRNLKEAGEKLTEQENLEFVRLSLIHDTMGLSKIEGQQLSGYFNKLSELRSGKPTAEYIALFTSSAGNIIADLSQQNLIEEGTLTQINYTNADEFINSPLIQTLRDSNDAFKKFFDNNHYQVDTWSKDSKGKFRKTKKWRRISAWTAVTPAEEKYYSTTKLINPNTGNPIYVKGKPGGKYSKMSVKKKYRTLPDEYVNLTDEQKRYYVDKGIVDNKGNFQPKEFKGAGIPGSAVSAKYKNDLYYQLEKEGGARFRLLEEYKKQYLKIQEGKPDASKLFLDQTRMRRKGTLEYLQGGAEEDVQDKIKAGISAIKSGFVKAKDDADGDQNQTFNYDPDIHLVQTDWSGNPVSRIPVEGLYKLNHEETSADILGGMSKYLMSLNMQEMLIKNEPIAKMMKSILNNEEFDIKNMSKASAQVSKSRSRFAFMKKGGSNQRADALNYYIDRMFYGKANDDLQERFPGMAKVMNTLMGAASASFIALDVPSAAKNRTQMTVQAIIEAGGGNFITYQSAAEGKAIAAGAIFEMSKYKGDIYKRGSKSLNFQMMEVFEAIPNKFRKDFGKSTSRTFIKDMLDATWLYDFRKLLEVSSSAELFFSATANHLVEQRLPNGEKKMIKLHKAYELNSEGLIKLKDGIDVEYSPESITHIFKKGDSLKSIAKEYGLTVDQLKEKNRIEGEIKYKEGDKITISKGSKFKSFKFRVADINKRLNGEVDQFNSAQANKNMFFKLVTFYRKFAIPMFTARFQYSQNEENKYGDVYDWQASGVKKGYYIQFLQSTSRLLTDYNNYAPIMTAEEKEAINKTVIEAAMIIALGLIVTYLFGFDMDDPDRFKKLEERQKSLDGWMVNHLLYLTLMTKKENELFNPIFGFSDQVDLIKNTSIATGPTIQLYAKIINHFTQIVSDDPRGVYKRDVGPYSWQKKGEYKIWNDFGKMFGLKGGTYDPAFKLEQTTKAWTASY
jgi:murein DD-endopeptidase MepM/ murein hydrolase activator NlpD